MGFLSGGRWARGRGPCLAWRGVAALCAGSLGALLAVGAREREVSPGAAVLWVADRGADRVVALDRHDLTTAVLPLPSPRRVRALPGGGLWILAGPGGGPNRLVRANERLEVLWSAVLGPVRDLAVLGDGDAVVIESRGGAETVLRIGAGGRRRILARLARAECLAAAGRAVLVGRRKGGVVLLGTEADPGVAAWGLPGRSIAQVAPGPRAGWWWALETVEGGTIHMLGPGLALRWSRSCGLAQARMAPVPGTEGVWLASGDGRRALRLGRRGALAVEPIELPLRGVTEGRVRVGHGVTWGAAGALLRLDAEGRLERTQGGFGVLSSLAGE